MKQRHRKKFRVILNQSLGFYLLGVGEKLPPQKVFPEKKLKILILFDDDIKESVKVTNVQKCDFSQS